MNNRRLTEKCCEEVPGILYDRAFTNLQYKNETQEDPKKVSILIGALGNLSVDRIFLFRNLTDNREMCLEIGCEKILSWRR